MKCWMQLGMAVALVTAGIAANAQNDVAPQMTFDEALAKAVTYDFGQSREALTVISNLITEAAATPQARDEFAGKLAALLGADATYACKQFVCRELSIIGTAKHVPALTPLLADEKLADMARYALERIPGTEADNALLSALDTSADTTKIGIINSLGQRGTAAAAERLVPLADDGDPQIAEAAIYALGKIGGPVASQALAAKCAEAGPLAPVAADAYLLCADQAVKQGDKASALGIYRQMYDTATQPRTKIAALDGMVKAGGNEAIPVVLAVVENGDADMQAIAMGFVREIPGAAATKAFADKVGAVPPATQALLLNALADRGDKAALPAAVAACESGDASVRTAALAAVGALGGAKQAGLLAAAAASGDDAVREAARRSMGMLKGKDVNRTMVAAMKSADPAVQVEIVRSLAARNAKDSVTALINAAQGPEEAVRLEALKALAALAEPNNLPALVGLMIKAPSDKDRAEAGRAIVAAAKQVPEANQRASAVLVALPGVKDSATRGALLALFPQIGDSSALGTLRTAAASDDAQVKDVAIRALADWPDAAALDDALGFAKNAPEEAQRVLALRGFLRMLALPSGRSGAEALALYKQAMDLAARPDEQKMVLAGMADVTDPAVIEAVKPYAQVEELKAEAQQALDKIRARIMKPSASVNGDSAVKALDKDAATRWDTGAVMNGGEWFMVDLGWDATKVKRVVLDTSGSAQDYPRGYEVYVATAPDQMGEPVASGTGSGPITEIVPKENSGRYLKIVQTGKAEGNYWSIHEMTIETE